MWLDFLSCLKLEKCSIELVFVMVKFTGYNDVFCIHFFVSSFSTDFKWSLFYGTNFSLHLNFLLLLIAFSIIYVVCRQHFHTRQVTLHLFLFYLGDVVVVGHLLLGERLVNLVLLFAMRITLAIDFVLHGRAQFVEECISFWVVDEGG